jgi:hypothetical protein
MESDFTKSIMDKIEEKKKAKEKLIFKNKELEEEYKKAYQLLGNSKEFKLIMKTIVHNIGLFNSSISFDARDLLASKGKQWVYLELIRPYLDKNFRKDIENE